MKFVRSFQNCGKSLSTDILINFGQVSSQIYPLRHHISRIFIFENMIGYGPHFLRLGKRASFENLLTLKFQPFAIIVNTVIIITIRISVPDYPRSTQSYFSFPSIYSLSGCIGNPGRRSSLALTHSLTARFSDVFRGCRKGALGTSGLKVTTVAHF